MVRPTPNYRYQGIPGTALIDVHVYDPNDNAAAVDKRHGDKPLRGHPISQWRKEFGGGEGDVVHPGTGNKHHVSLKPHAHLDPDKTYLAITYRFRPTQPIRPEHQHLFPPAPWKK